MWFFYIKSIYFYGSFTIADTTNKIDIMSASLGGEKKIKIKNVKSLYVEKSLYNVKSELIQIKLLAAQVTL